MLAVDVLELRKLNLFIMYFLCNLIYECEGLAFFQFILF